MGGLFSGERESEKSALSASWLQTTNLRGKTAIVTGSNTGIGLETAFHLVELGCNVILACRSTERGNEAAKVISRRVGSLPTRGEVIVMCLDLSDLDSVARFADEYKRNGFPLHILVNNAGLNSFGNNEKTKQGLEMCFGVNYLGHFFLVQQLMPLLIESAPSRVVNLSSVMHRFVTNPVLDDYPYTKSTNSYSFSKLAMIWLTSEIQRRYSDQGVTSVSVNPGAVASDIWRGLNRFVKPIVDTIFRIVLLTAEQGSRTSVAAATASMDKIQSQMTWSNHSARLTPYFSPYWVPNHIPLPFDAIGPFSACRIVRPSNLSLDQERAQEMWNFSERLIDMIRSGKY